jgi:hypothetical protein
VGGNGEGRAVDGCGFCLHHPHRLLSSADLPGSACIPSPGPFPFLSPSHRATTTYIFHTISSSFSHRASKT